MTRLARSRRLGVSMGLALAATAGLAAGRPLGTWPQSAPRGCSPMLATLPIPGAAVVSARAVPAGPLTPAFRTAPIDVPAVCQIVGYAAPTADSRINFELWVPAGATWNGKLLVFGNGGYSSALGYAEMARYVRGGYAVLGGDTGHTGGDLKFVVEHPERMTDWGTRSVGEIARAAKPVVAAVRGDGPRRTYFSGCSTGGHQAYAAVQHYPEVFDGVVAGAPGNNRTRLNAAFLWRYRANRRPGDDSGAVILPASKLPTIAGAVLVACDASDGAEDGVVTDPRRCRFDPASLRCTAGDGPACLTPDEVEVVRTFYTDVRNPRTGELVYPAFPPGAEAGYSQYWGTTEPTRADYWRHWVFGDAQYDWWTFDYDRDLALADDRVGARVDQVDPDLSAFKARGGKLIVYQGWIDPVVNALDTIAYYERVRDRQGSQAATDEFARLFLVPGMGHCGGGAGTSSFDMVDAIDRWVDVGEAPASIPAARVRGGTVDRTRPLCPYPQTARHTGRGSVDEAANFACAAP